MKATAYVVGLFFFGASFAALAQDNGQEAPLEYQEEWGDRIKKAEVLAPLGDNLAGDQVNYYNGQLSFTVTDIDLPGNSALPVRLTRTLSAADPGKTSSQAPNQAGGWDIELPYIGGIFAWNYGWRVDSSTPDSRCSSTTFRPPSARNMSESRFWAPHTYWRGNSISIPGAGSQLMLRPGSVPGPSSGPSKFVTATHWQINCLPSLANASSEIRGEGFIATSPNGDRYYFDWLTSHEIRGLTRQAPRPPGSTGTNGATTEGLRRVEVRIYATKVEDRFGNWVRYEYNGSTIRRIYSNDGRSITFSANSNSITSASAHDVSTSSTSGRTWLYGSNSHTVTLPDGTFWDTEWPDARGFKISYRAPVNTGGTTSFVGPCYTPGAWTPSTVEPRKIAIRHPSGARVEFTLEPKRHGRYLVSNSCFDTNSVSGSQFVWTPLESDNLAVTKKQISGAGLATQEWLVSYSQPFSSFDDGFVGDPRVTSVTRPDGAVERYSFGQTHYVNDGKLLKTEILSNSGSIIKTEVNAYATAQSSAPYASRVGFSGITLEDNFSQTTIVPRVSTTTAVNGDSFSNVVNSFDRFAREVSVTRSNSSGFSRTDVRSYYDDESRWVVGQVKSITNADTGIVQSQIDYDPASDKPARYFQFGALKSTYTYHPQGMLASVTNGANEKITLDNWRRGAPQLIVFADGATRSAVIDEYGLVSSTTDERGNTTAYGYDVLGRLASVGYPTNDVVPWSAKSITYSQLSTSELGISAGTWRVRTTEGNRQKNVYLDARYNPILDADVDTSSGKSVYTRRAFDHAGRITFESYPSEIVNPTAGVTTTFDALGRQTRQVTADGIVISQTAYLSGNRQQVTDADGRLITTSFQAFDKPAYEIPVRIVAPEGQTTVMQRDVFGKLTSATQSGLFSGSTVSYTRHYRYDAFARLCGRLDPESGTTGWGYDAAGRLSWELKGQSATSCVSTPPGSATRYSYDARGRKSLDDYAGGLSDVSYSYDAAGNLTSVANPTATWTYSYNKRNLLESEQAQIDGRNYLFDLGYDSQGNVSNTIFPDGQSIAYSPDAWGRPTELRVVGSSGTPFARAVQYHPSGAVASYALGNGLTYTQDLDARLRPKLQEIKRNGTAIQRFNYGYTQAGDLVTFDDQVDNVNDATLGYDALHRLVSANGLWGNYGYQYDPINNIRSRTGTAALSYGYEASKNLLTSVTGAVSRAYSYDARGRVSADGNRSLTWNAADQMSGVTNVASYSYDGNAKRIKTVKAGGGVEYTLYSRSGVLSYVDRSNNSRSVYLQLDGKTFAEVTNGTPTYLHTDLLGSPRLATSSTGATLYAEHFGPYGEKLNGVTAKIGYTGHAYDLETALTYAQARFYDPAVGRFLSIDPVGFTDDAFTFNRYGYANNNPYAFTDPDGNSPAMVYGAIAGGVGGYVSSGGGLTVKSVIGTLTGAAAGGFVGLVGAPVLSDKAGAAVGFAVNATLGAVSSALGQLTSQGATAFYESGGDVSSLGNVDFTVDPLTTALGAIGGPLGSAAGAVPKNMLMLKNPVVGQTIEKAGETSTSGYVAAAVIEGGLAGAVESQPVVDFAKQKLPGN